MGKDEREAVLARIANTLQANTLPSLNDAALFEQSVQIYHSDENDDHAGYRVRASKPGGASLAKLGEETLYNQVMIVATHLLNLKMPPAVMRRDFSDRLLAYLDGRISRAKLLGTRRPNTFTPQFRYFMGELANLAWVNIRHRPDAKWHRRLPERLSTQRDSGSLFDLLANLANGWKTSDLIEQFDLDGGAAVTLKELSSSMKNEALDYPDQTVLLESPHSWAQCYYDWKEH